MLPSYVSSSIEGRVRLRHPLLRTEEGIARVTAVLKTEERIQEIVRGSGSLLLFFDPSLKIGELCATLESKIQEFKGSLKGGVSEHDGVELLEKCFGISMRRLEMRVMLASLGAAILSIALGLDTPHLVLSALFTVMVARHIWERRRSM